MISQFGNGSQEMAKPHGDGVGGQLLLPGQDFLDRQQPGLVDQVFHLRPREACGPSREGVGADVLGHGHAGEEPGEEGRPPLGIRWAEADPAANPAGAEDGGVDVLGPVRGADDEDAATVLQSVEKDEELGDQFPQVSGVGGVAGAGDGVEFVHEDHGRGQAAGALEHFSQAPLTLADPLAQDLGAGDDLDVGA